MKVQCPSCREIVEMAEFSTSAAGLRFTCSGCGRENFLENPRAGESGDREAESEPDKKPSPQAPASNEMVCPKCGHAQYDPQACHRCGLMFDRFDPANLPPDPAEAVAAWERIQNRPEDQELHTRFLQVCQAADRLDYATRQYRLWSREPARRELAERMLAEVARRGQSQLAPVGLNPSPREPKKTGRLLLWIIVGISLGLFGYYLLRVTNMIGQSWP